MRLENLAATGQHGIGLGDLERCRGELTLADGEVHEVAEKWTFRQLQSAGLEAGRRQFSNWNSFHSSNNARSGTIPEASPVRSIPVGSPKPTAAPSPESFPLGELVVAPGPEGDGPVDIAGLLESVMEIEPPLVTGVPIVEYLLAPRTSVGATCRCNGPAGCHAYAWKVGRKGSSSSSAATYVTALKVEAGG